MRESVGKRKAKKKIGNKAFDNIKPYDRYDNQGGSEQRISGLYVNNNNYYININNTEFHCAKNRLNYSYENSSENEECYCYYC